MRISGALNNIMMRYQMPEETNEQDCSEQNSRNQEKNNKSYEKEVKSSKAYDDGKDACFVSISNEINKEVHTMDNKELKNPILNELDEKALDQVSGGTDDDGWYWGYGFPPHYLDACPRCGGGVYSIPASAEQGGTTYHCGPCGWVGHSESEFAPGFTRNR